MSNLNVTTQNNTLVVDSRLIAEDLGIQHKNLLQTITKYQNVIEQSFGVIAFAASKPPEGSQGGRPENIAYLTEDQATLLMSFSRNTEQVINCKVNLVKAFSQVRDAISEVPLCALWASVASPGHCSLSALQTSKVSQSTSNDFLRHLSRFQACLRHLCHTSEVPAGTYGACSGRF